MYLQTNERLAVTTTSQHHRTQLTAFLEPILLARLSGMGENENRNTVNG
jgi:hypothetical protein